MCLQVEMEAVVLFDYEKQQDDELDLTVGELITNVRQVWVERGRGGRRCLKIWRNCQSSVY